MANTEGVIEWNQRATGFIADARIGTPPANRLVALIQTAVLDGVLAVTNNGSANLTDNVNVALQAAVAAANRSTLTRLVPPQATAIESASTAAPAATQWPARQPWIMSTPSQGRPAPPPREPRDGHRHGAQAGFTGGGAARLDSVVR